MRLDLKYKFSAICNLVPARFLWDSRTRLKARHPPALGGNDVFSEGSLCWNNSDISLVYRET